MTLYFINKIYFSFSNSIFQINKTYLVIMAIVAAFNPINEVLTSFDVLSENGLRLLIATVISSVADLILMIFYVQRLAKLIAQSAEVSVVPRTSHINPVDFAAVSAAGSGPASGSTSPNPPSPTFTSLSSPKSSPPRSPPGSPSRSPSLSTSHAHIATLSIESMDLRHSGIVRTVSRSFDRKVTIEVPKDLVLVTIKNALLSFIGITSSFAVLIMRGCAMIAGNEDLILTSSVRCLDGMINIIVMYLMFAHSQPYYQKLCRKCHNGVQKCCFCITHSAILKKNSKQNGKEQREI